MLFLKEEILKIILHNVEDEAKQEKLSQLLK
jgi:hypothetical protein